MSAKKASRKSKGSKIDAFNRSQQIYKLLEKGIIETEALQSSAADRPEDDAHVLELLEAESKGRSTEQQQTKRSAQSKKIRRKKR